MSVVVRISLAGMNDVGVDCLVAQRPGGVLDLVGRVDQVTSRQAYLASLAR